MWSTACFVRVVSEILGSSFGHTASMREISKEGLTWAFSMASMLPYPGEQLAAIVSGPLFGTGATGRYLTAYVSGLGNDPVYSPAAADS